MRVLHVISSIDPRSGGPMAAAVGLAGAQSAAGMTVSLLATFRPGENPAEDIFRSRGVAVKLVGPCLGGLVRHPDLQSAADAAVAEADVVHIHALWEEVQHLAARAALHRGIPYIIRPCGMLTQWSLDQKKWKKRLYVAARLRKTLHRAAAIHFTTELEKQTSIKTRPAPIIEPNGVDLEEFAQLPAKGGFRRLYPRLGGKKMIVFLGRIHAGKGMEILIPALARLQDQDAMLVAVGPDSEGYQAVIEKMIDQYGVRHRVIFTGMLKGKDRIAALADADLFALPGAHENFGISVVEALAAGVPVVISDQVGICSEISRAGVGGVVPLDVDRTAGEISRWLADDKLRAQAAEKSRPFVWQNYDWAQIARRWTAHYQALIQ